MTGSDDSAAEFSAEWPAARERLSETPLDRMISSARCGASLLLQIVRFDYRDAGGVLRAVERTHWQEIAALKGH